MLLIVVGSEKIFLQCDPTTACEIQDKLEAYYKPEKNRLKMAMPMDFGRMYV
jgi:hypothetical protein